MYLACCAIYFSSEMASEMIQYVLKRGRAYRCLNCNYIENKSRMMLHFYDKHVLEYQIPFTCVPCVFKTGERKKLDRHLESPNHRQKVDLDMEGMTTLISQTPRHIKEGEDIEKLSKEDSARHWMGVSQVTGGENAGESPSQVEDIRGQLLRTEPMVLTPPQSQEEGISAKRKEFVESETQTERVPGKEERIEKKLDELKSEVAEALTNMFQYIDQLKTINNQQSELITRLNAKLDRVDEREEARARDREDRQRRSREHERGERDRRVVRDRSRGRERSRERK